MNARCQPLLLLLAVIMVTGCSNTATKQQQQVHKEPENPLFYNTMVAEIAGHRGDLQQSVKYYQEVIESTDDLDIIRRATRIMLFAKQYQAVNQAVKRWLELAPDDIEARQMAATTSLQQGDLESSLVSLEWLLNFAKDNKKGFALLAAILERVPDKQIATRAMGEMASRYPDVVEAKIYYARLAYAAKQYETSVSAAMAATQADQDNVDARIILARAQIELGDTDNALQTLNKLLQQNPDNSELRLTYARLLMAVNRYESAIREFEVLLKQSPDNADLIYSTALLSMQVKSYSSAENYLKKLLSLDKKQQEAWFYLGRLEEKRKRFDKAQSWYARVDNAGLYIDAQMGAARVQAKSGQREEAQKRYAILRESYPEHATAIWLSESEMLREINDDQAAYELLDSAVKLHADDLDLRYSRALAAERIDRIDILESDLRLVLEKEPDHAHALNALGYTLADRTNRYEEALAYILKAFELEPNDPAIIDSMGWIQYRLGNLDEAIEYLTRANEALRDGEVAAHLGEVLWVRGDREAANALWMKALREYPDSKILIRAINRFKP
ncbi:MAG: tetratricopeptide repeat protein [Gammaproteobacteria bacterium]|nr:tetratricopeptide repeat protein [Gammaproteobacteria bacterium]